MTRLLHAVVLAWLAVGTARGDGVGTAVDELPEEEQLYAAPTRPDRIGRIAAPVMINGQGPFKMILDTGATQSVITKRVVDALGLTLHPDSKLLLHGVTGSLAVSAVELETLETGALVQRNLKVAVLGSVMGGGDGILGVQGFEGLRVTVDFVRNQVTITRSRGERARFNEGTIPAQLRFGRLLVVNGHVGRIKVKAVIDTGAETTLGNLALRDALLRRRRHSAEVDDAVVIGLNDASQYGRFIHTPMIKLGEAEIKGLHVIYGDIHVFKMWGLENEPALLVGMDVLGALERLVIDYQRQEIQFRNTFRLP